MGSVGLGLIMWGCLLTWALAGIVVGPRPNATRKGARSSTPVSRNRKTGPAWEQDAPYPECFEEDDL